MITEQTFTLAHPFTAQVNVLGQATIEMGHNIHGLVWQVFQLGFALNQSASGPIVGVHFNGVPFISTLTMRAVSFPGFPYNMEVEYYGPPYAALKAGDRLTCTVTGATNGDIFTAAAYVSEEKDPTTQPSDTWWYK